MQQEYENTVLLYLLGEERRCNEDIAEFHYCFERIYPFQDGNGHEKIERDR